MKPRKTINVESVREKVNNMLARPLECVEKVTLCCLLEDILMETQNYHGFSFLNTATQCGDDDYYDRYYIG